MPAINRTAFLASLGIAAFAGCIGGSIGGSLLGYQLGKSSASSPVASANSSGSSTVNVSGKSKTTASQRAEDVAVRPDPRKERLLMKKEFESLTLGKTAEVIIAAVGRPDDTEENATIEGSITSSSGGRPKKVEILVDWWTYRDRVLNESTGRPYKAIRVRFIQGIADWFEYK